MSQISTTGTPALLFKFIDFIEVKLRKAECGSANNSMNFSSRAKNADIFAGLIKGRFKEMPDISEGSFYFIPGKRNVSAPFQQESHTGLFEFAGATGRVRTGLADSKNTTGDENIVSFIAFDTILYQAFPFFSLLELPPFVIPPDRKFEYLLREICIEQENKKLGREIILKNYGSELMVRIFRHLNAKPGFEKIIQKLNYLTDVRLIGIVEYIRENLDKELTNASLAKVAAVSDEYVGQYFKTLTGRTLQEYIESQRMERAMHLLQTIPNSVQEIAAMVGFRDAAYFSRRFRLHFKMNANVFRKEKATKPDMNAQHPPKL